MSLIDMRGNDLGLASVRSTMAWASAGERHTMQFAMSLIA